jgi:hypothetical protein
MPESRSASNFARVAAVGFAPDVPTSRKGRLLLSIVLALVSKLTAVVVQLTALPIALSTLGPVRYGIFLSLQSSFGWFGLAGLGLSVVLPRFLSSSALRAIPVRSATSCSRR